jgi:DNA repair exonuclease SbcCD ATPase subunit
VLDSLGIKRGALLIFEPRGQSLVLAAAQGIGECGKQRLRRVRRTDPQSWHMPLQGLLNQSAYLIDQPAKNRFVPQLLDEGNSTLGLIACIPIYRARKAVGTIVLLAGRNERVTEAEIQLLQVPLRYLATVIDDLREREGIGSFGGTGQEGADSDGPIEPVPSARPPVLITREMNPLLLTDVIDPGSSAGEQAAADTALQQRVAGLEAREEESSREVVQLQEELAATVGEMERRAKEWAEERGRGLGALRAELQEERGRALAALRIALEKEHERALATVGAERDEFAAQVASLAESVARARADLQERQTEAAGLASLRSDLAATRQTTAELNRQLTATQAELEARERQVDEIAAERNRLEVDHTAAREELDRAVRRTRELEATLAARGSDAAEFGDRLAAAEGQVEARGRAIQELKATVTQLKAEQTATGEEFARTAERASHLEAAIERRDAEAAVLADQLHAARAREREKSAAVTELTASVNGLEAESAALAEQCRGLEEQVDTLRATEAALRARSADMAAGESSAAAERERVVREEFERARFEWQAQQEHFQQETVGLQAERDELGNRLADLEERLREAESALEARTAAEAAAVVERARLQDEREAAQRQGKQWQEQVSQLSDQVTALEHAVWAATERAQQLDEREQAVQCEAQRWRDHAEELGKRIAALEQEVGGATNEAGHLAEREEAARRECERWRATAEQAAERAAELTQIARKAQAEATHVAEREDAARSEVQRWQDEAERLGQRVTALQQEARRREADQSAIREHLRQLEAELEARERARDDLENTLGRLERETTVAREEAGRARAEAIASDRHLREMQSELEMAEQARVELQAAVSRLETERAGVRVEATRARAEATELGQRLRDMQRELERRASGAVPEAAEIRRRLPDGAGERDQAEPHARNVVRITGSVGHRGTQRSARADQNGTGSDAQTRQVAGTVAVVGDAARQNGVNGAADGAKIESARVDAPANTPAEPTEASRCAEERILVLEPVAAIGKALARSLGRDRVIAPTGDAGTAVRAVAERGATVVGVNLGSRGPAGGIHLARALRRYDLNPQPRLWAYAAPPQASKAIALGFIEWSARPIDDSQLVSLLRRLGGRGTRILSVGLDMDELKGVREQLAQHGISLSMACDAKQGQELLGIVNPHSVLVNLDVDRGDGYRALGRLAADSRRTWVLLGGATPPAEAASLLVVGATQHSPKAFLDLPGLGAALLADVNGKDQTDAITDAQIRKRRPGEAGIPGGPSRATPASAARAALSSFVRRGIDAVAQRRARD